jgi:hypothetical protein
MVTTLANTVAGQMADGVSWRAGCLSHRCRKDLLLQENGYTGAPRFLAGDLGKRLDMDRPLRNVEPGADPLPHCYADRRGKADHK